MTSQVIIDLRAADYKNLAHIALISAFVVTSNTATGACHGLFVLMRMLALESCATMMCNDAAIIPPLQTCNHHETPVAQRYGSL